MSIEQDIFNKLVQVYPHGLKKITDLSYNKSDAAKFLVSDEVGFDYDLVHNHSPCYSVAHKEKTPDSLFCINDKLFFVEFKEGSHAKSDIRLKIHEGMISLYMFVKLHMPHVTRDQFFSLDVVYAVIVRAPLTKSAALQALRNAHEKYQLKNIEGFWVGLTLFTPCPVAATRFLKNVTGGKLKYLDVVERSGTTKRITA